MTSRVTIDWKPVARGRKEDRGHTVVMVGEWGDPMKRRAFLKCQCGAIYSAQTPQRAYQSHAIHKQREFDRMD